MSEETQEIAPISIEGRIDLALVKQNVTEEVIAKLREDYLPLKIAGIEDKETYLIVKDARKHCKELRVLAKKICIDGREDAVAIQKAWVSKEKDITGRIGEVEDYLEKQEKEYEAAVAKEKEDRKRKQEEQLIMRQQVLTGMGALYSDGNFILGEVSFELSVVKESESDIWEETILPKFKAEYEKVEAERIELDRIRQEREAELKRQQDEIDRQRKELADKEAAFAKAEEARLKKEREEFARKEAEAEEKIKSMISGRCNELQAIGMTSEFPSMDYVYNDVRVTLEWIKTADPQEWAETIGESKHDIGKIKADLEQKRLAEIEEQKEDARKKSLCISRSESLKAFNYTHTGINALADYSEEEWLQLHESVKNQYDEDQKIKWEAEQEQKRQREEIVRLQKLDAAKDKEKWDEILSKLNEVVVYEMRSSQYRKKAMILREKLEEIKSL